jgi:hypothetical protein
MHLYKLNSYVKFRYKEGCKLLDIPSNQLLLVNRCYVRNGAKYYRLVYKHDDGSEKTINVLEEHLIYDLAAERDFKINNLL